MNSLIEIRQIYIIIKDVHYFHSKEKKEKKNVVHYLKLSFLSSRCQKNGWNEEKAKRNTVKVGYIAYIAI